MKFNRKLVMGLLGGAMLALPMTAPAFAEPSYTADSAHFQRVDWWWDHYQGDRDGYSNHGWHEGNYEWHGHKNPCQRARGLQAQVWQDRQKGHPAAANEVEQEAAEARARCYNR